MWDDILYKFGRVRFGKTDDDDTMYYALYELDECICGSCFSLKTGLIKKKYSILYFIL